MEREIKFRAWDEFQKKYVFTGFHICGEVTAFGGMESVIYETWKERSAALGYTSTIEAWNDFEFEQFTGVLDSNGKEIYESDKVKLWHYYDDDNNDESVISEVKFMQGGFVVEADFGDYDLTTIGWAKDISERIEVIGNVRENSELL